MYGAKIDYTGPDQFILSNNLASANAAPEMLTMDVEDQRARNRLIEVPTLPARYICSPLCLILKVNGGWRRIHHLSHPEGNSVNDFIPEEWGALEYFSFDEALAGVRRMGKDCLLIKRDPADAFRHVPVAQSDWWLLSFC